MGKFCCAEQEEDGGINILGILVAVVLALVLMLICSPPRRRAVITVKEAKVRWNRLVSSMDERRNHTEGNEATMLLN
ncbi:hypothetical protein OPV22_011045 [Ensete ventricosum]|uniref:Transmembrane protein n=1 Tax=Ensete ventricosum TaxID=4639 RepID=A0AAV8RJL7_ENSVE|nr:hypothetical protein OPV22_011045 [Ensete ventricosum]